MITPAAVSGAFIGLQPFISWERGIRCILPEHRISTEVLHDFELRLAQECRCGDNLDSYRTAFDGTYYFMAAISRQNKVDKEKAKFSMPSVQQNHPTLCS